MNGSYFTDGATLRRSPLYDHEQSRSFQRRVLSGGSVRLRSEGLRGIARFSQEVFGCCN